MSVLNILAPAGYLIGTSAFPVSTPFRRDGPPFQGSRGDRLLLWFLSFFCRTLLAASCPRHEHHKENRPVLVPEQGHPRTAAAGVCGFHVLVAQLADQNDGRTGQLGLSLDRLRRGEAGSSTTRDGLKNRRAFPQWKLHPSFKNPTRRGFSISDEGLDLSNASLPNPWAEKPYFQMGRVWNPGHGRFQGQKRASV